MNNTTEHTLELLSLVNQFYGLTGQLVRLGGDVDFNYRLHTGDAQYLVKLAAKDQTAGYIDFQIELLNFIKSKQLAVDIPVMVVGLDGQYYRTVAIAGEILFLRVHSWVAGSMVSEITCRTNALYKSWGTVCGYLSNALSGFDHPHAHRYDKWNPVESLQSRSSLQYMDDRQRMLADYFWNMFEDRVVSQLSKLNYGVNYSDAHEHNLLWDSSKSIISGVIDFGDAIYAPVICELAIACAYAGMYVEDPIAAMGNVVQGYHEIRPLSEVELEVLFPLICGRLIITLANAAKQKVVNPTDTYQQISAAPATALLEQLFALSPEFVHYSFRSCCGLEAHPLGEAFGAWRQAHPSHIVRPIALAENEVVSIDLSVGSQILGNNLNFEKPSNFNRLIDSYRDDNDGRVAIGGYGEVRPFYTTDSYISMGNSGRRWRTMHLGVDYWTEAGVEVLAIADGIVHMCADNDIPCDYGPTIILSHMIEGGIIYYSLYGHLSRDSLTRVSVGDRVMQGEVIAKVGNAIENGGWPPHLHCQIFLDMLGHKDNFPGVCYVSEAAVWLSLCPSVELSLQVDFIDPEIVAARIMSQRESVLGKSLSTSYDEHLHMVRGYKQFLYDSTGRRFLDLVNNVAHVGHEHPTVVKAACTQMGLLNTNTRYLHDNIVNYAERLLSKCPAEMGVVFFVNSGSEANELALRMAQVCSGGDYNIALSSGYHGNTGATIAVSSYKFDGKGGEGAPQSTAIVPMPDIYRGQYRDADTASTLYAMEVHKEILERRSAGQEISAFLAESILSCGGQIVLPDGYLAEVYGMVRSNGGLCIADEVQVGFGRVGEHYWGFELQEVVPDIITCGKPIGNGHPLAAVITTQEIADRFANGMEYFNTYGGNPVSCAVGLAVLDVIDQEDLQANAAQKGSYLLSKLDQLAEKYDIIGDVRGRGLFIGIEFVRDHQTLEPADIEADYIVNRLRDRGILLSTDGPLHNVIKLKPPMCVTRADMDFFIVELEGVLEEL